MCSKVTAQGHAFPVVLSTKHPSMRAAAFAYRKGFGRAPVFLRCGGTIPVVNTFKQTLGIPTILMGFALPDEKFFLPNFYRGIATSIWFLHAMGTAGRNSAPFGWGQADFAEVLA